MDVVLDARGDEEEWDGEEGVEVEGGDRGEVGGGESIGLDGRCSMTTLVSRTSWMDMCRTTHVCLRPTPPRSSLRRRPIPVGSAQSTFGSSTAAQIADSRIVVDCPAS